MTEEQKIELDRLFNELICRIIRMFCDFAIEQHEHFRETEQ